MVDNCSTQNSKSKRKLKKKKKNVQTSIVIFLIIIGDFNLATSNKYLADFRASWKFSKHSQVLQILFYQFNSSKFLQIPKRSKLEYLITTT